MANDSSRIFYPKRFSYLDAINLTSKRDELECSRRDKWLFEELRHLLEYSDLHEWTKKTDKLVVGSVLEQYLGTVYHKHTKHVFTCLYVGSQGPAIMRHGHTEVYSNGTVKKTKEFYVFPDGHTEFCGKDMSHELENNSGEPMYVISVKITGRGHRKEE